ncbi:MAG: pyridoxal phosphate-dependent aminotransferase [Armatimonadota bacterium]
MNARPANVGVQSTGISVLYSLISKVKQYPDGISLGRGDPDFDTPAHIRDAVRQALEGRDPRTSDQVHRELLEAISARLRAINRIDVDPQTEIVLSQGGQEALFLMILAALAPGDEIIVPEPNYSTYMDAIAFAGAVRVPILTKVEDDFDIDPDLVRAAMTPKTRALVLVSPNNPTAAVLSPERVETLAAIAEEHDLIVLADDIYDRFLYDGAVHTSPASLPGMKARTLTLNALSKMYAMTGWRLGWVAGPAPFMTQVRRIKEAVSGDISALSLRAGLAALTGPQDALYEMQAAYARRRRLMMETFDRVGLRYGRPQGGQFMVIDIRRTGLSSLDLATRLIDEAHVVVYPGVSFGEAWDGFIRMTFLQPEPVLADALERVTAVLARLM